jgi:hypothetical protein
VSAIAHTWRPFTCPTCGRTENCRGESEQAARELFEREHVCPALFTDITDEEEETTDMPVATTKYPRTITQDLEVRLTSDELVKMHDKHIDHLEEIARKKAEAETELAAAKAKFKSHEAAIEEMETTATEMRRGIRKGFATRPVRCEENIVGRDLVVIRLDTKEEVSRRYLTDAELQVPLPSPPATEVVTAKKKGDGKEEAKDEKAAEPGKADTIPAPAADECVACGHAEKTHDAADKACGLDDCGCMKWEPQPEPAKTKTGAVVPEGMVNFHDARAKKEARKKKAKKGEDADSAAASEAG